MRNELKVMAGFLVGAAAGVVTGILFAPDKGVKTRKKLTKEIEAFEKDLEATASKKLKKAQKEFNHKVDEYTEKGKKALKDMPKVLEHIPGM